VQVQHPEYIGWVMGAHVVGFPQCTWVYQTWCLTSGCRCKSTTLPLLLCISLAFKAWLGVQSWLAPLCLSTPPVPDRRRASTVPSAQHDAPLAACPALPATATPASKPTV
jgi:hypothetical protein